MKIRKAKEEDIPDLVDFMMRLQSIEKALSTRITADKNTQDFLENKFIKKRINNKKYVFLIGFEKEKPIGVAIGWKNFISPVYKNAYVGYVCNIIVGEKFRGKGYGKKLTKALEDEFKKMGLKEVMLEVLIKNKKSHDFWKNEGYENLYIEMRKDL